MFLLIIWSMSDDEDVANNHRADYSEIEVALKECNVSADSLVKSDDEDNTASLQKVVSASSENTPKFLFSQADYSEVEVAED